MTNLPLSSWPREPLLELVKRLEIQEGPRAERNRLRSYSPYAKQAEFHAAGKTHDERLLMAGNQLGKTLAGGMEWAMHLTGRYPDWWRGRAFDRPVRLWAAGVTSESTRDNPQRVLVGPPQLGELRGSGTIPADAIKECIPGRGIAGALDAVVVRWGGGSDVQQGESVLAFKSYEKGREKWQGETLDGVWFDEEPPLEIYSEGRTRCQARRGIVIVTFTPLLGMTEVVKLFLGEADLESIRKGGSSGRGITFMTIDDAEHYTPEQRAAIVAGYLPHEREARAKGIPVLGSGRVFAVPEERIRCEPFAIPPHWTQINGLDFGWDHPFGAVHCAWDRDADVFYVCKEYREREATPVIHAAAVKPWGDWVPCAWPHDGLQHDKGSGEELARAYARHGLAMLPERATFEDGTNGVEAGVLEMLERMQTGRWKVFSTCGAWFSEFGLYHREGGRIVKTNDDLISASRYAFMMRRFAVTRPAKRAAREPRGTGGWMA